MFKGSGWFSHQLGNRISCVIFSFYIPEIPVLWQQSYKYTFRRIRLTPQQQNNWHLPGQKYIQYDYGELLKKFKA